MKQKPKRGKRNEEPKRFKRVVEYKQNIEGVLNILCISLFFGTMGIAIYTLFRHDDPIVLLIILVILISSMILAYRFGHNRKVRYIEVKDDE